MRISDWSSDVCSSDLADLVEKLPARVAPAHVALRDYEKALTLASLLPELSDRSFFRGVRAVGDMGAFVLDVKPAAIFQLGDEVRIELAGRGRQPERIGMAGNIAQPELQPRQAVDGLRALEFLAIRSEEHTSELQTLMR